MKTCWGKKFLPWRLLVIGVVQEKVMWNLVELIILGCMFEIAIVRKGWAKSAEDFLATCRAGAQWQ